MALDQWTAVDAYLSEKLGTSDPALEATLQASAAAGLPSIQVSATQGKFLHLLARSMGAKKILEIGTLGGYSTTWLARALPADGRLITLEYEQKHVDIAQQNITHAGLDALVQIRHGRAIDTLPTLTSEAPFDLVFIDADKPSGAAYFQWALKLTRPGSLILVDNVVRKGAVVDPASKDENVIGTRKLFDMLATESRVSATTVQTVGSKGYDGFVMALVTAT